MSRLSLPLRKAYWHYISREGVLDAYREAAAFQWLSPDEITHRQWINLKRLLQHAYDNVPYYHCLWREKGITPDDIRSREDFLHVPILTKKAIQENLESLIAANGVEGEPIVNHTGGSTGEPLTFYQDRQYHRVRRAMEFLSFEMCGYKVGDKQVFIWGSDYDSQQQRNWRAQIANVMLNKMWINAFDLDEDTLYRHALCLSRWKPDFVLGYTSSVALLARLIQERGITGIRPRGVQLTAEVVTPAHREKIGRVFNCPVFDRYGCREMGIIAHECTVHRGLHVFAYSQYVELLRGGKPVSPGETGSIVVTNLGNYAMPFIRYQTGDLAMASDAQCECGRGLPLMQSIKGRMADTIISPSGKFIHGEFFTHLFYKVEGVRRFQVVQETPELLIVRILPDGELDPDVLQFLENVILEHGDPAFQIQFDLCDHIKPTASGKYRFTESKVSHTLTRNT